MSWTADSRKTPTTPYSVTVDMGIIGAGILTAIAESQCSSRDDLACFLTCTHYSL